MGKRLTSREPAVDPTALKRQIADLQAANAELAEVYRTTPVGLCHMDIGLRYRYINEWLACINGLPVDEHIGRDIRDILPQVAEAVLPEILPVLETREPIVNTTRHVETAAQPGIKRLYQCSYFATKSPDGTITGVNCVVADITDVFAGYMRDISKHEATKDLRTRFVGQVFTAQEQERRRIAVDLHDGVCQMLTAAKLRVESIISEPGAEDLSMVSEILRKSIDDIRAISHNLHPTILDDLGIVAAIKKACRELNEASSCQVDFESEALPNVLPRDMQNHLFRLVQEALQNAVKHSHCDRIVVNLRCEDSVLEVRIRDDGVGFTPEDQSAVSSGSGITNMRERARVLGAELTINSAPSGGTEVCLRVPWPEVA